MVEFVVCIQGVVCTEILMILKHHRYVFSVYVGRVLGFLYFPCGVVYEKTHQKTMCRSKISNMYEKSLTVSFTLFPANPTG